MIKRRGELKQLIESGQMEAAIKMATAPSDYGESESFVHEVLGLEKSSPELVDATLEAFRKSRQNWKQGSYGGGHGGWVHSLSHFTEELWKRRLVGWIKKFNEIAFQGALELGDSGCCDRLVCDFAKYAHHDDKPADFALFVDKMPWLDLAYYGGHKLRIEHGVFESPEALERFQLEYKLRHPSEYDSVREIQERFARLKELGAPTDEFADAPRKFLEKKLREHEEYIATIPSRNWASHIKESNLKERERSIQEIQKQLAALS